MKITITDNNNFHTFEVDANEEVENIKALVQVEMGVPSDQQQLMFQGQVLQDKDTLDGKGIKENELIYLLHLPPKPKPVQNQQPQGGMSIADLVKNFDKQKKIGNFNERRVEDFMGEAEKIYTQMKDDHYRLSELSATQPDLVNFVLNKDIKGIAQFLKNIDEKRKKKIFEEQSKFRQLAKDPMNPEYQKMLEERIRQENVEKNLQYAQQYIPEVFGHINMLYINASVNKVKIQAFVDSGAQSTIMSQELAEKCGLMRLIDKRAAGTAVGVGSCKILGKIHAAEIEIENKFITCSFTVIQNNSVEFLLGLDMLKRFSCLIDLKNNELVFQDGLIKTKFLGDGEIKRGKGMPKKEELEEKLKKLNDMGFATEEALQALKACNYNEQIASNMLMQRKYGK